MNSKPDDTDPGDGLTDVEGHRMYSDENIKHDVTPVEWEDDSEDTEGHRILHSDENVKHDVTPVEWEDDTEDTEGHRIRPLDGDESVPRGKGDRIGAPPPRSDDDEEDVEGHWGQASDNIPPPKMDK